MRLSLFSCTAVVALTAASPAWALLRADQIVILANAAGDDSKAVAAHYCKLRGVPAENVCVLELTTKEYMTRARYAEYVVPTVKKFLADRELTDKVRCLLTVFGVPLKIQPRKPVGDQVRQMAALNKGVADLSKQLWQYRQVAAKLATPDSPATTQPFGARLPEPPKKLPRLRNLVRSATRDLDAAVKRVEKITDANQRALEGRDWTNLAIRIRGLSAAAMQLQRWTRKFPDDKQLAAAATQLTAQAARVQRQALLVRQGRAATMPAREKLELQLKVTGLIGTIGVLKGQADEIGGRETMASFDSELSMLNSPKYRLNRWQSNPMYMTESHTARGFRALMTARIDGPTVAIAKRLVDDAVAVEKTGLTGKVYVDARGMKDTSPMGGGYGGYDASLRAMAAFIKKHTKLEVVLEDTGTLFGGDKPTKQTCPDAALYGGWYRLSRYVDSFTWARGSVAFHIASGECTTLRRKNSQVWCKRMIEEGVAATCGPTFEPYLQAFPRPHHFFPLLMTGKKTLAETYWQTVPWTSWAMVLVGDPLYNPFAKTPLIKMKDLPLRIRK